MLPYVISSSDCQCEGEGTAIRNVFSLGSQSPDSSHIFWELIKKGQKYLNYFSIDSNVFCTCLKKLNKLQFIATKNGVTANLFFPASFFVVDGSGIWDENKNLDSGSLINIPDPEHLVVLNWCRRRSTSGSWQRCESGWPSTTPTRGTGFMYSTQK